MWLRILELGCSHCRIDFQFFVFSLTFLGGEGDTVSLCNSPGCHGSWFVDRLALNSHKSAFMGLSNWSMGLKVCSNTGDLAIFSIYNW